MRKKSLLVARKPTGCVSNSEIKSKQMNKRAVNLGYSFRVFRASLLGNEITESLKVYCFSQCVFYFFVP